MDINFKKITKDYTKDLMTSLDEFIAIKSVFDESTVSKTDPFGKGVTNALKYFENLAKNDGFIVNNYDNKVVEVLVGEGDKNITIMAHADVVPEGEGWETDPYKLTEKKGVLYARGVADDKGPALACYYALKALRDNKLLGKYTVRFLVGGNEECGSACMEHYFQTLKKPQPTYGFSPDSNYPVIFAEKGIFGFEAYKTIKVPGLISIKGGTVSNAVIEKCEVCFELNDDIVPFIVKNYPNAIVKTFDDIVHITFIGVGAHGSVPQEGKNAGMMAIEFVKNYTGNKDFARAYEMYSDVYGKGVNAASYSIDMGSNSLNVGIVSYENNKLSMIINFRFVDTANVKDLKNNIVDANGLFSVRFSEGVAKLLYFKKDSPLIKTLVNAYQKETGDYKNKPLAVGGGTYAKEADNVVAFGAEFPNWDSRMHTVGERIKTSDLLLSLPIYARAIYDLGKLIENENKI